MEVKSKWAAAVFIVMALVLALGMAVVAAPAGDEAEAATQQWSGVLTPNPTTLGVMPMQDIVHIELSPNFATDNTIYAITVAPGIDFTLFTLNDVWNLRKSTNGGYWWETTGTGLGAGMPATGWVVIDMAVAPDDPSYVVVACTNGDPNTFGAANPVDTIYASSDGGATFSPMGADPTGAIAGDYVTSVDVSPLISGIHQIMVGVADNGGGVTAAEGVYVWGVGTPPSLTWTAQNLNWGEDVFKVVFSTNYQMDFAIVALSATVATVFPPAAGDAWLHIRDTSDNVAPLWDDVVVFPGWPAAGAPLWDSATGAMSPHEGSVVQADLALPDDFDGTRSAKRVIYAATGGGIFAGGFYVDDAWRVTAGTPWRLNVLGGASVPISSLDHVGNISGGNLLAGGLGGGVGGYVPDVYSCTTPYSGTPMWMSGSKLPTGFVNTQVRAAPDYLTSGIAFASTMGPGGFLPVYDESALSKCYDFADTWNQTGLIDTDMGRGIIDVAPIEAQNVFFTSVATSGSASLWTSLPGGMVPMSLWERVDMVAPGGMLGGAPDVEISPNYATDNTVYWADTALGAGGGTLIRVSQDGGAYFATRNALTAISDYVVADANTLFYVDAVNATVYKSSDTGHTWPTTGVLMAAANIVEQEPVTGALGVSGAGIISTCLATTVHPLSFTPVGIISPAGALQYIAFSNEYDSDGILYVATSAGGVYRVSGLGAVQLDLTAALANMVAAATGIAVTADGTLYVSGMGAQVDNDLDGLVNEDGIDGVDNDVDGAIDEDPADNAAVWRTMNPTEDPVIPGVEPQWVGLNWGLLPSAQLGGLALTVLPLTAVTGLETISGSNVLFSVNVGNDMIGAPALPPPVVIKHTLVEFTDTLVTTVPTLVSPTNGSVTGVVEAIPVGTPRVRVDFKWSAVPNAHQYRLQVDTDAGFHNPVVNVAVTAPDVTFTSTGMLNTDMKYYWRVRVEQFITTAGASPWSAAWSLLTPVGTAAIAPEILGPENGAKDVRVENPCFTWGSVTGATEYKLTLKDSSGTVLVDTSVTETSYCYAGELEYETSYVWTVQGTSATTESGAASATFSTEEEAEPTPAWVWIIIAIGAVVAIVVIVLIVRTRRPA